MRTNTLAAIAFAGVVVVAAACSEQTGRISSKPTPTAAGTMLFHDDLSVVVTGRPTLEDDSSAGMSGIHVRGFALATGLPVAPGSARIYLVDPTKSPNPEAVGRAFGITQPPTDAGGGVVYIGGILYKPKTGSFQYGPGTPGPTLAFAGAISDSASAIQLAGDFLVSHGLYSRSEVSEMSGSAKRFQYGSNPPFWSVRLVRTIHGVPSDIFWSGAGASFQVRESGDIQWLSVTRVPIVGYETSTLIDASTAWKQITEGHWYFFTGLLNNGPINVSSFRADVAQLCYLEANEGKWLIPMWCFTDNTSVGHDFPLWIFYPALTPGTFDWTLPNRT